MGSGLTTGIGPAAWVAIGAVFGITAAAVLRRVRSWRDARSLAEWDPY